MRKISFVLAVIWLAVQQVSAVTDKAEADLAYQGNDFTTAIKLYEEILDTQGESADIYYNLGNSYYKCKEIAKAILNYERAILLNPNDADIRFNLEMAKNKSVDQITPMSEVFIYTWINNILDSQSEKGWANIAIVAFLCFLISVIVYIFGCQISLKKIGFAGAIACLIVTGCSNFCASEQKNKLINRTGAVVMLPTVTAKSTPSEGGTDLFVIHEGTKVYIEDSSMKKWKEVRLEDGKKGWLPAEAIEVI